MVGAPFEASNATGIDQAEADNSAANAGAVYVYSRSGTGWAQQAYIKASNTEANDGFGWSLALSADGNTLAVSAVGEDSNASGVDKDQADNSAAGSGAVYVFTRSGTVWSQQAYVKASNTEADDGFGWSLALSADGNTMAVGAPGEASNAQGVNQDQADNKAPAAGAVYVFTRSGSVWAQQAYVKASNSEAADVFGWSVALSADGNILAAGARAEDGNGQDQADNSVADSGAVYVYGRSGTDWSQQAYVKASNSGADDWFGWSVALNADGNTLLVGAPGEASNARGINQDQTDNSAAAAGAVYVFSRGTSWSQQAYVKASNADGLDQFGSAVGISSDGNFIAVGAPGEDSSASGLNQGESDNATSEAGAVYVFNRNAGSWSQQTYVKASNTGNADHFGWAVALSGDSNTLAVGAKDEDSSSKGIDAEQVNNSAVDAGAVFVY